MELAGHSTRISLAAIGVRLGCGAMHKQTSASLWSNWDSLVPRTSSVHRYVCFLRFRCLVSEIVSITVQYTCNTKNVCADPPGTPVRIQLWQYILTGVGIIARQSNLFPSEGLTSDVSSMRLQSWLALRLVYLRCTSALVPRSSARSANTSENKPPTATASSTCTAMRVRGYPCTRSRLQAKAVGTAIETLWHSLVAASALGKASTRMTTPPLTDVGYSRVDLTRGIQIMSRIATTKVLGTLTTPRVAVGAALPWLDRLAGCTKLGTQASGVQGDKRYTT